MKRSIKGGQNRRWSIKEWKVKLEGAQMSGSAIKLEHKEAGAQRSGSMKELEGKGAGSLGMLSRSANKWKCN